MTTKHPIPFEPLLRRSSPRMALGLALILGLGLFACQSDGNATDKGADGARQAAETSAEGLPVVVITTNKGVIEVELYPDKAPETVRNFLSYVDSGHYDGTIFHRVIKGFMIQGGGFEESGRQKPTGKPIQNEAGNGLTNDRGTIAMARTSAPHSATAQFFINTVDNQSLNYTAPTSRGYGYAVFGKVISGMDVVDAIESTPVSPGGRLPNSPKDPVIIESTKRR